MITPELDLTDSSPEPELGAGVAEDVNLRAMLWPQSIAIVGASANASTIRGRPLAYLLQREYAGELYLVSPTQPEICGRSTVRSVRDLPGPIDLVLIAAPADATYSILQDCAHVGAKFAICFGSGFAESGAEGARMQQALTQGAARAGLRICGPNTAGFFNGKAAIPATFARNVDLRRAAHPSHRTGPGTVSIVAQSGGLAFALSDRCAAEHGLRVNYVVSTGNEVDLQVLDFVNFAIGDEDTKAILLLVEAIKQGERLPAIARRALSAGKPIIVSKFGRTAAGRRAANSHAARLAGADEVYAAVFKRHGLIRVDDEEAMTDLAAAFSVCPLPRGRRVGILTTSGGAGVWMADACELMGLAVPVLDPATQTALQTYIPGYGAIHNPVDMTAQVTVNPIAGVKASSPLSGALRSLLLSEVIDSVVLIANMSDGDVLARERESLQEIVRDLKKPLFLYSHAPPSRSSEELVQQLGLICLASTHRVAQTIAGMVEYAEARDHGSGTQASSAPQIAAQDQALLAGGLCEYEAKALLGRYGIAGTTERLARSADEAAACFADFAQPVAMKIQSRQIPHKTEIGGVILGLSSEAEVRAAYRTLLERAAQNAPQASIDGVLVQTMLEPGTELALGIVHDVDFGPMMMVGLGGIHIEVFRDVVIEPLPIRRQGAVLMLQRLRAWPLLSGARGRGPVDVEALAQMMEKLSCLVEGAAGACREIDVNPVFVYEEGGGAVVVDALIVGRDEAAGHAETLR